MSKIKVKGHDSGTGVITIEAPNTSTDRTLTLPDSTGELLSTAGGTMTGDLTIGTVGSVTSSGADLKITGTDDIFFNVAGATNNILQLYGGSSANDQSKFDSHVHPLTDNSKDLGSATERWKDLYLSGGLKVGGTGADNTLDDYEEGTWTPTASSSGWDSLTFTDTGSYTKIGNIVHVMVKVSVDGSGTGSGDTIMGGLPFTSSSTGDYRSAISIFACRLASDIDTYVSGYIDSNSTTVVIREGGTTGDGNDLASHFDSGSYFYFQATYRV